MVFRQVHGRWTAASHDGYILPSLSETVCPWMPVGGNHMWVECCSAQFLLLSFPQEPGWPLGECAMGLMHQALLCISGSTKYCCIPGKHLIFKLQQYETQIPSATQKKHSPCQSKAVWKGLSTSPKVCIGALMLQESVQTTNLTERKKSIQVGCFAHELIDHLVPAFIPRTHFTPEHSHMNTQLHPPHSLHLFRWRLWHLPPQSSLL